MTKILLLLSKDNYPKPEIEINIVPQGLPYIASSLEHAGYDVYGLNPNYVTFDRDVKEFLKILLVEKIKECRPRYIGLGALSANYLFIRDAINIIRDIDPEIKIILGGGIISSDAEYIFEHLAPDYGVILEGEITIVELLRCLDEDKEPVDIKGIIYKNTILDKIIKNPPQNINVNIDDLPYPNFDIFDIEKFYELSNQENMYFTGHTRKNPRLFVVSGGRSCPFKCTFCYHSTGTKYQNRPIESIIKEMKYFHKKYNFNIIHFYDELFSINKERIINICNALIQLKKTDHIDVDWTCTMRVNQTDMEIVEIMKEAGCFAIGFGFESASDPVLLSMKKKVTKKQMLNTIKMCEDAQVGIQANFIFGDPVETIETQKETVQFINEYCHDHIVHFGMISPFPGSPIWNHCINEKVITDKKIYYENIHSGNGMHNLMNMTQIPDEDFFKHIDDTLRIDYTNYKTIEKLTFDNQIELGIQGECPHCHSQIEYLYPRIPLGNNIYSIMNSIAPKINWCSHCHKRIVIPTISLFENIDKGVQDFIKEIKRKLNNNEKVVLILGYCVNHITS
ncbi:MAG: radical SAM protein, partial [Sulfurovum sp.]|nr:radical SAM protein [Sulfurovaceae bacterium]